MCQSGLDGSTSSNYIRNTNMIATTMAGLPNAAHTDNTHKGEEEEEEVEEDK